MSIQKVLIAVDEDPVAAHAAEVGVELARDLHAQVALIYVIDPALAIAPDAGIAADELAVAARQDAARLVANFRARLQADAVPSAQATMTKMTVHQCKHWKIAP